MYVTLTKSIQSIKSNLMILLITSLKEGVKMQLATTTKSELTAIIQTLAENYIRNSYLLASGKQDDKKALETLNNRKIGYLSYVMKTAHRIAIFTGSYDYSMQVMKQRAITVANNNDFTIPKN